MLNRRDFLRDIVLASAALALPAPVSAKTSQSGCEPISAYHSNDLAKTIASFKSQQSSVVKAVMGKRRYRRDPYTHYPKSGGILDDKTKYRVLFHAHRPGEYGHFHTYAEQDDKLVHLVLISIDRAGIPFAISTVNQWVSGDVVVPANELIRKSHEFGMDPKLFPDPKIYDYIRAVFALYRDEIERLFIERDAWIADYITVNGTKPDSDEEYEILSSIKINPFTDHQKTANGSREKSRLCVSLQKSANSNRPFAKGVIR